MRVQRRSTTAVPAVTVLAAALLLGGCSSSSTGSLDEENLVEDMSTVIDAAYAVAIEQWEDKSSFPRTDAQFARLAEAVGEELRGLLPADERDRWRVQTYRGDYGGNRGLLACAPEDVLTLRIAVPRNGRSIGFGAADDEVFAAVIYDPDKIGNDEQFNDDGFYASSGACATEDTELDATTKAVEKGRF
jgi:hypothetical protein